MGAHPPGAHPPRADGWLSGQSGHAGPAGRAGRADARRNAQRILDATAKLIADEPAVSLERVAAHAEVSRATLYHHFANRDALLDALTERSVAEVAAALHDARPSEGTAMEAMGRVLRAAWQVVGRYRGLVIVNPARLNRADLRARLEPALGPLRALIARGQQSGEFDPELPAEWLIGVLTDLIHAASRHVTAGAMGSDTAERVLLRSAAAALTSHRATTV
jgi:AcrR family transcriptional regulator